jgi:hypothetical protein
MHSEFGTRAEENTRVVVASAGAWQYESPLSNAPKNSVSAFWQCLLA